MDTKLTFEEFLSYIHGLADILAPGHPIEEKHDTEKGLYMARVCGTRYTARPGSRMITGIAGTHRYVCTI